MSMVPFTPGPDLGKRINELTADLEAAETRADRLEVELKAERRKNATTEKGVAQLRTILSPLHQALGMVFGQIDAMGVSESNGTVPASAPKMSAAWEQWKERLGGATARAIDALMVHGEMNQTQLRIILGCATRTVTNVVAALNQAKLIDKRDGKIRLKEL